MENTENKEIIPIILALVLPGTGHIYIGKRNRGIKISITFVLVSYISNRLLDYILFEVTKNLDYFDYFQGLLSAITFIPIFIVWYKQLKDIIRIIESEKNIIKRA